MWTVFLPPENLPSRHGNNCRLWAGILLLVLSAVGAVGSDRFADSNRSNYVLSNSEESFVTEMQKRSFLYFEEHSDPVTGLTTRSFIPGNATDTFGSIGAGFRDGRVDVAGLVDALQAEGLITVLAEPTLTAVSGESASFLSGGEFPVPVSQGLQQITIEWKRFGVNVDFSPIVLNGEHMSIKVRPEVSELTDLGSVVINNIKIPGLAVRRAETTVELASGQSFAIAGLFQNNVTSSLQQLPGLGDVPVLGTLFRSSKFQRHESELVIIVTPYIVRPAETPGSLHVPTEGIAFSSDLERILLGRLTARGDGKDEPIPTADTPHLNGAAGFILER